MDALDAITHLPAAAGCLALQLINSAVKMKKFGILGHNSWNLYFKFSRRPLLAADTGLACNPRAQDITLYSPLGARTTRVGRGTTVGVVVVYGC